MQLLSKAPILILQVGWYNGPIEEKYKLSYPDDTLGVLAISIPDMWEKAFIPFAKEQDWDNWNNENNPLHECMIYNSDKVKQVEQDTVIFMYQSFFLLLKSRFENIIILYDTNMT